MTKFTAKFHPQAWVRDYAIEVDAEGPTQWDCTALASQPYMADYLSEMTRWFSRGDGWVLDASDVFKEDPAAPEWVHEWHGPFDILIREEANDD